jgi:hypothetical protein
MYIWKTKHGYHIQIESENELSPFDIPILQMALLSDWRRELFNQFRVRNGIKNFNILFYTKEKFKKVVDLN